MSCKVGVLKFEGWFMNFFKCIYNFVSISIFLGRNYYFIKVISYSLNIKIIILGDRGGLLVLFLAVGFTLCIYEICNYLFRF